MVKKLKKEIENNTEKMTSFFESGNTLYMKDSIKRPATQDLYSSKQNRGHKFSVSDISGPVAFDPSKIKGDEVAIRFNVSNRDVIQSDSQTLLTFPSNSSSDRSSISSDSGISSDDSQYTIPKEILENNGTSQQLIVRKKPLGKNVAIPTIPANFTKSNTTPSTARSFQVSNDLQKSQLKESGPINFDKRKEELQNKQDDLQKQLDNLKEGNKSFFKSKQYKAKKENLKSQLYEVRKTKWEIELGNRFESDKGTKLLDFVDKSNNKHLEKINKIVQKYSQQYGHYTYDNPSEFSSPRSFVYTSFKEVLDRANPTYEDKQILLRYDAYQTKTLLEDKEEKLTKEDQKVLKEIYKDLKDELKKSKKDFYPSNDKHIQNWREVRSASPQSIVESVSIMANQLNLSTQSVLSL